MIAAFREANPRVNFVLKDVIASRVLSLVRTEEVDLGIMGGEFVEPGIEVVYTARIGCTWSSRRSTRLGPFRKSRWTF